MGQYWIPVNLDKREFIDPHQLGAGLKLGEQICTPTLPAAIQALISCMPERRGGGDLVPHPAIGRWAGDRVVMAGDYSEDSDLPSSPVPFSQVYSLCVNDKDYDAEGLIQLVAAFGLKYPEFQTQGLSILFKDITAEIVPVIEVELDGKFKGDGWKDFIPNRPSGA